MNTNARISPASHWLVSNGLVDQALLGQLRASARVAEQPLVCYLVGQGYVDSGTTARVASRQFGLPCLDLDALDPAHLGVKDMDPLWLRRHQVLPLCRTGNTLVLGIADPACDSGFNEIAFRSDCKLDLVVVEADKLSRALREQPATEAMSWDHAGLVAESDVSGEDPARDLPPDSPLLRYVNRILLDGIGKGASDIHIEFLEKTCRIRYRIDGQLQEIARLPPPVGRKITARLKILARLDIAEKRLPQDGRLRLRLPSGEPVDFRLSTLPALWGEKSVLRVVATLPQRLELAALGFSEAQKLAYCTALSRQQGLVLVTGPTGSGKTLTLYAGLQILNSQERNIETAEDPVEMQLEGVNQVAINPAIGLTYSTALKAFLRQDPDVLMIGEIRDPDTAAMAIRAAQTGHLVLSTLHTNGAVEAVARLLDMGLQPFQVATTLTLVIAQRLLRRLCSHCKIPLHLPDNLLIKEGFSSEQRDKMTLYGPTGCGRCQGGYRGRVGVYEILPLTATLSRVMMDGGNSIQIADIAAKEGFNSLRNSALAKAALGLTSLTEVNRVT